MSSASVPARPWPDLPETERRVLLELLLHGSQARVRLAERVGLSRASLTRIARGLIDAGLITEGETVSSGARGRPGESLDLRPDAARFLGLKLTGDAAYVVCTNLAATVLSEASTSLPSRDFDEVTRFLGDFLAEFADGASPVALGVAVAGDVVTRDGQVLLERSNFLGWNDVPLSSRLSDRVPWAFDDEAVAVTRRFAELKLSLMPYLWSAGAAATRTGLPLMRPMALAFPEDPSAAYLDRQYMLGPDVLVAPVFSASGDVEFYLPEGRWTSLISGEAKEGARWHRERHGFDSLPLYVREGAVLPWGARTDRPDYDYLDGLTLEVFPGAPGTSTRVVIALPDGEEAAFVVRREAGLITASGPAGHWGIRVPGGERIASVDGRAEIG